MGTRYDALEPHFIKFIEKKHIFFCGTAANDGRVNVSPKGKDSLRVLSPNRIIWRNLTGSGNETASHLDDTNRMTLMWCSFDRPLMILRCYGTARAIHRNDDEWQELNAHFEPTHAARQIFDMDIELVQRSCGFAVPKMEFVEENVALTSFTDRLGEEGVQDYWVEKNSLTIDGKPTHIAKRNLASET